MKYKFNVETMGYGDIVVDEYGCLYMITKEESNLSGLFITELNTGTSYYMGKVDTNFTIQQILKEYKLVCKNKDLIITNQEVK